MNKLLFTFAALLTTQWAFAHDFVRHHDNRPQNIGATSQVQVINFWATWCKPCRKEMPDMSKWYQQTGKKQKINMVGIALDTQENVASFLKQTPVAYEIWRYTGKDSRNMMKNFGNKVGALPYTVVRASSCGHQESLTGELTIDRLNKAVQTAQAACQKKKK